MNSQLTEIYTNMKKIIIDSGNNIFIKMLDHIETHYSEQEITPSTLEILQTINKLNNLITKQGI